MGGQDFQAPEMSTFRVIDAVGDEVFVTAHKFFLNGEVLVFANIELIEGVGPVGVEVDAFAAREWRRVVRVPVARQSSLIV